MVRYDVPEFETGLEGAAEVRVQGTGLGWEISGHDEQVVDHAMRGSGR